MCRDSGLNSAHDHIGLIGRANDDLAGEGRQREKGRIEASGIKWEPTVEGIPGEVADETDVPIGERQGLLEHAVGTGMLDVGDEVADEPVVSPRARLVISAVTSRSSLR